MTNDPGDDTTPAHGDPVYWDGEWYVLHNVDRGDDTTPPHAEPLQFRPLPRDDGRQAALARLLDELEQFFAKGTTETEMRFLNKVQRLKYSRSTRELLSIAEWGS